MGSGALLMQCISRNPFASASNWNFSLCGCIASLCGGNIWSKIPFGFLKDREWLMAALCRLLQCLFSFPPLLKREKVHKTLFSEGQYILKRSPNWNIFFDRNFQIYWFSSAAMCVKLILKLLDWIENSLPIHRRRISKLFVSKTDRWCGKLALASKLGKFVQNLSNHNIPEVIFYYFDS